MDNQPICFRCANPKVSKRHKYCTNCSKEVQRISHKEWKSKNRDRVNKTENARRYRLGLIRPMTDKDTSQYLGIYIAERVLSRFFDKIVRMPHNNPGYDFLCGKNYKIDVKSGTLRPSNEIEKRIWCFKIEKNKIPNYFLLLGFDDRDNLNPMHVWLVPGNIINEKYGVSISNSIKILNKWKQYERPLDKVLSCCSQLRGN